MIGEEKKICSIVGKLKKKRSVKFIGQEGRKSDRHAPAPIFRYAHVQQKENQQKFRAVLKTAPSKTRKMKRGLKSQRILKRSSEEADLYLKQALDDIQQRGGTFCKFGLLSSQKTKQNRKVFGQYFNLKSQHLRGTIGVGELWPNKQRAKFFKQNRIYVNKLKLVEKIGEFKKQQDEEIKRLLSQDTIATASNGFQTLSQFKTTRNISESQKTDEVQERRRRMNKNLFSIRKNLAILHRGSEKQEMSDLLKSLESHSQSMGRLEKKYFLKMIQIL